MDTILAFIADMWVQEGVQQMLQQKAHMTLVLFSTLPLIAHLKVNMKAHELKQSSDTPVPLADSGLLLCGSHIAI